MRFCHTQCILKFFIYRMWHEEFFLLKTPFFFYSLKKTLYDPFLWTAFHRLMAKEPLLGVSLFFTTKSPGVPGTCMIDQGRIKGKIIMASL